MKTIIKLATDPSFKLGLTTIMIFVCVANSIQAQQGTDSLEVNPELKQNNTTAIITNADIDWKKLQRAMSYLGPFGEYASNQETILSTKIYEDIYYKKRSQLAEAFWNKYPEVEDKRRDEALYTFFHPNAEPHFISKEIPDSIRNILDNITWDSNKNEIYLYHRLVPRDALAFEKWRETGNEMVASVLKSNATLERKEAAEGQLLAREFRVAYRLNFGLAKDRLESNYWNRFEVQYWQNMRFLLEDHINKYAALENAAIRVKSILDLVNIFSPAATKAYWKYFFGITGKDNPLSEQAGIKALHKIAGDNITAIGGLKEVDYATPIEMVFTAIDGTEIDLSKMRGKVVLIDFWDIRCSPCIKEMPHVQTMYDKYNSQGFEVIGIAADGDQAKEQIERILKKTGAIWPQRLDNGKDASMSFHSLYGITSLPTVWLLNKDGIIVDRNARGARLETLIRKYLDLDN